MNVKPTRSKKRSETLDDGSCAPDAALLGIGESEPVQQAARTIPGISGSSLDLQEPTPLGASDGVPVKESGRADLKDICAYTQDLVGRKYDLYTWCETKINILVAVDGFLLSAVFVVVDRYQLRGAFELTLATVSVTLITLSVIIGLYHIIPKMNSGVGNEHNIRSVIGVVNFGKTEFHSTLSALTYEAMIRYNSDQIYGMNTNVMRNQRAIRFAVVLTVPGLVSFLILFFTKVFYI